MKKHINIVQLYSEHNALSDRTRGHCWKVCKERNSELNIRNESFPHRSVQISWNCLPAEVVRGANVDSVKNSLIAALEQRADRL